MTTEIVADRYTHTPHEQAGIWHAPGAAGPRLPEAVRVETITNRGARREMEAWAG